MSNDLYNVARVRMVTASFDWQGTDVFLMAWSGTYKFDEQHRNIADVTAAGGIRRSVSLPSAFQTYTEEGIVQTSPYLFPLVSIGPPLIFFTLTFGNVVPGQEELIAFYNEGEGLPYEPKGLDVLVQPDWLSKRGWFRP